MSPTTIAWISGVIIAIGTFGSLIPFFPGLPLALAGIWLDAVVTHFHQVSLVGAIAFSILVAFTFILEILAPAIIARGYKSSAWGSMGASIGAIVGIFSFGPWGVIIGPFVGAYIGEYLKAANTKQALRSAWGATVGIVLGSVFKVIIGLSMLVYFLIVVL